jgi:TRAP-type mannitol/chloroaromatic compound transport system permease large subunit
LAVIEFFTSMPKETIGIIMIGAMLFAIFVGFPISFTLIFLGVVFGYWAGGDLVFFLMTQKFSGAVQEQTLAAVPMFVFMGIMMEQAGLMERLFRAVQLMLATMRGSLYVAVLFVSTIFAAATGIVGASVTILGIMAAKTMNRSGYDVKLAAGTITAGGTLGILIPPSIMLVVMGPVLEVPVTDLFAAAIIPGIMLAFLYMAYALIRTWLNGNLGPPLPEDERPIVSKAYWAEAILVFGAMFGLIAIPMIFANGVISYVVITLVLLGAFVGIWKYVNSARPGGFFFSEVWREFALGLVPPAALVAFALGSILFGWATPSEGAGCGAFGALVLTLAYGRFNLRGFGTALIKTLEISVLILFLVAASDFFGAVFAWLGTPTMMTNYLLQLDLSPTLILIMIMVFIFLLGWPLEWVPIVLIIVPILLPILEQMEINLLWFGILVAVNLQTAWLSPPVALSAYFLKGVVPEWDLKDIYLGMMQFMVIQAIGLVLIFTIPEIALWLPEYIYSE